jgi:ribosomal protein S18 acetylase RimI-like enzyme
MTFPAGPGAPPDPEVWRLLSRIEDASLNASAPPQQRWLDGWLLRLNPGKAQRARSVQPLAEGVLTLDERLAEAGRACAAAGVPLLVRITPFSRPVGLDTALAGRGFARHDETCVLWRRLAVGAATASSEPAPSLPGHPPVQPRAQLPAHPPGPPTGVVAEPCSGAAFAATVGALRGSSAAAIEAHAQRLLASPVPYRGLRLLPAGGGPALACAQVAREGRFVGLYDVHTAPEARGRGLARYLCERLLSTEASDQADIAYLQVGADNDAARRLYARLGFVEGYRYHYRAAP